MRDFETYYPPKPKLVRKESKNHVSVTIFSMVLFALTFSLIIDDYIFIGLLLLVLLIHELGHFAFMKIFGYKKLKMFFIPFIGAMVQGEKKIYSQIQSLVMILAGPIPGIVLGSILLIYGAESDLYIQIGILFLFINVMNLIPVSPLDGGRVFEMLFFQNHELMQLIFSFISSLGIIAIGFYFNSWLIMAFGFLMGFRVKTAYKNYQIRSEMKTSEINYELDYENLSDRTYNRIKSIIIAYNPVLEKIKEESEEEKYEQIVAHQVDGILVKPMIKDAGWLSKLIVLGVWFGALFLTYQAFISLDFNLVVNAFQFR
jgi:Zn-dependent protease